SFSLSGSFVDPGADTWTGSVDFGDGTGAAALAIAGMSFTATHRYDAAGNFAVTVRVADDDTTSTAATTVSVRSRSQAVQDAIALVDKLVAMGKLPRVLGTVLKTELTLARVQLDAAQPAGAQVTLRVVVTELDIFVQAGVLSAADAAPLRSLL